MLDVILLVKLNLWHLSNIYVPPPSRLTTLVCFNINPFHDGNSLDQKNKKEALEDSSEQWTSKLPANPRLDETVIFSLNALCKGSNESKRFWIAYPANETCSPILAPSGGSKGSTVVWSSFEAHKTCKEKPNAHTALETNSRGIDRKQWNLHNKYKHNKMKQIPVLETSHPAVFQVWHL